MSNFTEVGTVTAYRKSGYGWLDWDGKPVFIHIADTHDKTGHLLPALKVGWKIQFEVLETPKGFRAMHARVVDIETTNNTEETDHVHQSR
jgi:cold shock CspA family protein